jgi:DivIVA domain-containing protein
VFWFQLLVAVLVLGGIAWVAAGRGTPMAESFGDRPDLALPSNVPLRKPDVDSVRFSVGLRGYRMDEVDAVLDRLAAEIDARDGYISQLSQEMERISGSPAGRRAELPGSEFDGDRYAGPAPVTSPATELTTELTAEPAQPAAETDLARSDNRPDNRPDDLPGDLPEDPQGGAR